MFRRTFVGLVVVSAVLVVASPVTTAASPELPKGSRVFISPMDGFDTYIRAATKAVKLPLVFVRTRAEADYEITGVTKPNVDVRDDDHRTTRQRTVITLTNITSGQTVFTHSVDTRVESPNQPGRRILPPAQLLHRGKQTAARACVSALQQALNAKP